MPGRLSPEEIRIYTSDMQTGDVMTLGYRSTGSVLVPEGSFVTTIENETEGTLTSTELLLHVYTYPQSLSWRDMVLIILMVAVQIVSFVLFIITLLSMWIRHRYQRDRGYIPKDLRFRPLPIICFFLIQQVFLAREFYTALYELDPKDVISFKVVIGALILIIAFYGYRRKKDLFHRLIILAVFLLTCADIMMTFSITAGALLYIASYILLCVNFAREDKPGVFRILVWILLSAAGIFFLMRIDGDFGYLRYLAILYIVAGAALVVTAFTHSARTSRGSILLVLAGILIVLNTAASTGSGFSLPKIMPEYNSDPAEVYEETERTTDA